MFLHLGKNVIVPKSEVVTVCDLDNSSQSYITRNYLSSAEKKSEVVNVSGDELPKSFVVCERDGQQTVYLSQLNPATLLKRSETSGIE